MIVDAQATPRLANKVVEKIRSVTDKPIKYVVLSHYHAVRVLGASAYGASEIIASQKCRAMVSERGKETGTPSSDASRACSRATKAFQASPGRANVHRQDDRLSRQTPRRPDASWPRAHTAGDIVAWVPDEQVMFTGDIVEYHSACYCGDGHFNDWGRTLDAIKAFRPRAIAPGRGDALVGDTMVNAAIENTRDFVESTYRPIALRLPRAEAP